MKLASGILILLLSLSLGGVQLFQEIGIQYARSHASRMMFYLDHEAEYLQNISFSKAEYDQFSFEEVGNRVTEFSFEGWKYDVFKTSIAEDGSVVLLVKKDTLETKMLNWQKGMKRFVRNNGKKLHNSLFNFYFSDYSVIKVKLFLTSLMDYKPHVAQRFIQFLGPTTPPPNFI